MKISELIDKLSSCDSWGEDGFYTVATGRKDETTSRLLEENKELIINTFGSLSEFATYLFGIGEARNYLHNTLYDGNNGYKKKYINLKKLRTDKEKIEWDNFKKLTHGEQIKLLNSFAKGAEIITDYNEV